MASVAVGIYVHSEPRQLHSTLAAVRQNTSFPFELLILPDGPDSAASASLHELNNVRQLPSDEARGTASSFNRFVRSSNADILVYLESGSLVAPGWLDHILAALDADPRNGLAGPSTNMVWNEQCVFPGRKGDPAALIQTADDALARFGSTWRTLEPLHSLADFCYVVRREVVDSIGLADEKYGLGPCWEMDYNVRAARAGWRGVWVCSSYVWRSPMTARRQQSEEELFEINKRRYQDKFCGARLRGEKRDYRSHCRGDACPNFAPAGKIQLKEHELSAAPVPPTASEQKPRIAVTESAPLVSCIMPTYNRLRFVKESVRYFQRQDYPNLELIVVDDGSEQVKSVLLGDPRIKLIQLGQKKNVGTKRNIACAAASGSYIVHWDDDDWYPGDRVSRQISSMVARKSEICGTSTLYYYEAASGKAWCYRYSDRRRGWVAGNTLAYSKRWWSAHPFPEIQVGEDTRFVWGASPALICDLAMPELCVARVHTGNTSRKLTNSAYWHPSSVSDLDSLVGEDWPQFVSLGLSGQTIDTIPLVSCIMPTFNRRPFLRLALASFQRQDYQAKELVVIDDGTDPVGDVVEGVPQVRYLRLSKRHTIGEKRNRACAEATGKVIAHWDDDDWYAPERLSRQVAPILSGKADLTGLENSCVLDLPSGKFWATRNDLHSRMFVGNVHGGTLTYRTNLIRDGLQFPSVNLAEDAALIRSAQRAGKRLLRLSNDGVFVYVRHGRNAWRFQPGKFLDPDGWYLTSPPAGFSEEQLNAYMQAVASSP
jgi:glycosyltransferase involved in cell wall biosynthesis